MPRVRKRVLLGALLAFAAFVGGMEAVLKARGIRCAVPDSEALWMRERARASALGSRALILVGSSRMQTDMDLDVLRSRTGLEPVQLAIDGTSFWPVLDGLARDASVRGTVIVAFQDDVLAPAPRGYGAGAGYEADYEQQRGGARESLDYTTVEGILTDEVRNRLRSYADGARPLTSLLTRVLPAVVAPQYAIVLPDRSRLADYAILDPRIVYYSRVIRDLGKDIAFDTGTDYAQIDARLRAEVDSLPQASAEMVLPRAAKVMRAAAAIAARGGRVFFVVLPTSGLITIMEERRFPRQLFWDRFAAMAPADALHFEDVPPLREFPVPDGSHIDYRNRAVLTNSVLDALRIGVGESTPQ